MRLIYYNTLFYACQDFFRKIRVTGLSKWLAETRLASPDLFAHRYFLTKNMLSVIENGINCKLFVDFYNSYRYNISEK